MSRLRTAFVAHQRRLAAFVLLATVLCLVVALLGGYVRGWSWVGVAPSTDEVGPNATHHVGKTLWDWLDLLIVPVVLAGGALWLSRVEQRTDREAADRRAQSDREIADDRAREAALQSYLDRMDELLLDNALRESAEDAEVRQVARARTLATLRMLDSERMGALVRFLSESHLVQATVLPNGELTAPVVSLAGAHLVGADLVKVDLAGANLEHADLRGAKMEVATLTGAHLCLARLANAYLPRKDFRGANLEMALLSKANLNVTDLRRANLRWAMLPGASLYKADLRGADLRGANLGVSQAEPHGAFMREAALCGADMRGASLRDTDLDGADLRGADFGGVKHLTQDQLNATRSYKDATHLPAGLQPDTRQEPTAADDASDLDAPPDDDGSK